MVGDDYEKDIAGARALGMPGLLVGTADAGNGGVERISDLAALRELLAERLEK
jgi:FMN phosphatase YigB (HAD superfamily)